MELYNELYIIKELSIISELDMILDKYISLKKIDATDDNEIMKIKLIILNAIQEKYNHPDEVIQSVINKITPKHYEPKRPKIKPDRLVNKII